MGSTAAPPGVRGRVQGVRGFGIMRRDMRTYIERERVNG